MKAKLGEEEEHQNLPWKGYELVGLLISTLGGDPVTTTPLLFLRHRFPKMKSAARSAATTTAAPTAMPAFAPVDKPDELALL